VRGYPCNRLQFTNASFPLAIGTVGLTCSYKSPQVRRRRPGPGEPQCQLLY
jgi:hypothetical protein